MSYRSEMDVDRETAKREWSEWVSGLIHYLSWDQTDLARHCGVPPSTVSRWINPDPRRGTVPTGSARKILCVLAQERGWSSGGTEDHSRQ